MSFPAEGRDPMTVHVYAVPRPCEERSTIVLHGILADRRIGNTRILDLGSGGEEVRNQGRLMGIRRRRTGGHPVVLTKDRGASCRDVAPLPMLHGSLPDPG